MLKKKVVLVGDWAVGKTSLINRFTKNTFSDKYIATIGSKVSRADLNVSGEFVSLMIWDILGQQEYTTVQASALRGAAGAILVSDLTRKETLENLTWNWVPKIMESAGNIPMVFLGNKSDLTADRQFGEADLHRDASEFRAPSIITSALTGDGVKQAFAHLGTFLLHPGCNIIKSENDPPRARPITTIGQATDAVMMDFCTKWGSEEDGMAILRHKFQAVGLDINAPQGGQLSRVIDLLEELEAGYRGPEQAEANARFRRGIVRSIGKGQPL